MMKPINQKISQSKTSYDSIQIPKELESSVKSAIHAAEERHGSRLSFRNSSKFGIVFAVALLICFTIGLNASPAFAAAMMDIPVIGTVSKFLTFREYDYKDADKKIHQEIPNLQEDVSGENNDFEKIINEEINKAMEQYRADANTRIEEYKQAFIETGGTSEEFSEKEITVDAGYEICYESNDSVSFVITANESWCGAYGVRLYYNLDLKSKNKILLKDLLGEDYINIANASIKKQMEERMIENPDLTYWGEDMDGFTTINSDTNFYINGKGNPVIVFEKYEIAPGAYGIQEFEIVPE